MQVRVTAGRGEGPTSLAAFDAALLDAGVCNYNLICLSSVIPPDVTIERGRFVAPADEYGHRLYVVMAHQEQDEPGKAAWAGLGWTQEASTGRGLFVELHGERQEDVAHAIQATLESMIASRRDYAYGPIQSEIAGINCQGQPVCALVIAVYQSEGWKS